MYHVSPTSITISNKILPNFSTTFSTIHFPFSLFPTPNRISSPVQSQIESQSSFHGFAVRFERGSHDATWAQVKRRKFKGSSAVRKGGTVYRPFLSPSRRGVAREINAQRVDREQLLPWKNDRAKCEFRETSAYAFQREDTVCAGVQVASQLCCRSLISRFDYRPGETKGFFVKFFRTIFWREIISKRVERNFCLHRWIKEKFWICRNIRWKFLQSCVYVSCKLERNNNKYLRKEK